MDRFDHDSAGLFPHIHHFIQFKLHGMQHRRGNPNGGAVPPLLHECLHGPTLLGVYTLYIHATWYWAEGQANQVGTENASSSRALPRSQSSLGSELQTASE